MVLSIEEWRRRILEYFCAGRPNIIRATTKEKIFASFGSNTDCNLEIAFTSLERDNLIVYEEEGYYTLNFDKTDEIKAIVFDDIEDDLYMSQPLESELEDLVFQFVTESGREYPPRAKYYHYTKKTDFSFWVSLVKTKPLGKSDRINLGSLNDPTSRISRIWQAVKKAANGSQDGIFIRKRVEEIEPMACGNNRQPSKAAFDIFKKTGLIKVISYKGNSEKYKLSGLEPVVYNLDTLLR